MTHYFSCKQTSLPSAPLSLYSIVGRFFFSVFSLKSSVNCLNTIDKFFAPMEDNRPCLKVWMLFLYVLLDSEWKNTGKERNLDNFNATGRFIIPYRSPSHMYWISVGNYEMGVIRIGTLEITIKLNDVFREDIEKTHIISIHVCWRGERIQPTFC